MTRSSKRDINDLEMYELAHSSRKRAVAVWISPKTLKTLLYWYHRGRQLEEDMQRLGQELDWSLHVKK